MVQPVLYLLQKEMKEVITLCGMKYKKTDLHIYFLKPKKPSSWNVSMMKKKILTNTMVTMYSTAPKDFPKFLKNIVQVDFLKNVIQKFKKITENL